MWAHLGEGGWREGREENLLGVTKQRNHIRLRDSLERKTVGGQNSLCGKHRLRSLAEPERPFLSPYRLFPITKCNGIGNMGGFFNYFFTFLNW